VTFVEAARIYEAKAIEKPIAIHGRHYNHIALALQTFKLELFVKSLGDRVLIKLGPNETRAIAFVSAMLTYDFVNDEEKKVINSARQSIRVGRFQKLPREINKLLKKVKEEKINNIDQFHGLMKILASYPLLESENTETPETEEKPIKESQLPEIIISESFS